MTPRIPRLPQPGAALPAAALAVLAALAAPALHGAVPPVPRLDSASTAFLQRGTTNVVTLSGDGLAAVASFLGSGAGFTAVPEPQPTPGITLEGAGVTVRPVDPAKSLRVRIGVASDAPLGARELRVGGPGGVSNPLVFQVGGIPEIAEPDGTAQASSAPALRFPVGVSGRIGGSAETDHYRFTAAAGEELVFDLQANRTGSPLDANLIVTDAAGRELARSEDAHGLDPFVVFKAPAAGEYGLRIHDLRHLGGDNYRYHLVAGAMPYVETLFPFGGRRGSVVDVQLIGHRLGGADRLTLALAGDAPTGRQDLRAHTADGHSNPIPFEVGDLPEVLEAEPNDARDKATAVNGATTVNGRVGKAGDVDHFKFRSAADQRWVVDVQARRFGSPLDALLTLTDAEGKVLQRNDDAAGPDARIEFDAKKDTDYYLVLRDLTDRGGDRFAYRMTVQPPDTRPDFTARTGAGRVRLHRGGWLALRCDVARRNGFDGIVRLTGAGLPPGVSAVPFAVGAGSDAGWILLGATEDAAGVLFPLRLQASGELAGRAVVRDVQLAEAGWLTLLPPAPFSVDVGQASASVEQDAGAKLDVAIVRQPGFDGEVKVIAEGPPGVNIPVLALPPGKSRGQLPLNAAFNAATGTRSVMVRAEAVVEGQTLVQAAPRLVDLTVQGIPLYATSMLPGSPFFRTDPVKLSAAALPTNSASAANRTEFVVKVERRGFDGEVAVTLDGVPAGVLATVQPVAAKAREATIQLLVTEKAEAGKEHKIGVTTSFTHNDRIWRQKTTPVTLTIPAPEVAAAPTNAPTAAPAKP